MQNIWERIYPKILTDYVNYEKISFKENVFVLLIDYNVIDKSDFLNIHRY